MARPVWTGALSFGLVSMPVQLYSATRGHTIHFHQLQRGTTDRVRNRRVNERTGEEVPPEEIVKGLDMGEEEYVVVEPGELEDIAPGRSKALEISGFVDLDEVEPIYFDRTYYLGPKGEEHQKVYALLCAALAESHRAGIATFVMRGKEYLVAVKAEEDILALHTLHWADEVRDPGREVADLPGATKPGASELRTAVQLVETLSIEWNPEDYQDTYQENVRALVEAKQRGERVEKAKEAPESTNVVDLMEVLRASVDDAKSGRRGGGSRRTKGAKGAESARSSRASGSSRGAESSRSGSAKSSRSQGRSPSSGRGSLSSLSKGELYERASKAGVRGRSTMSREELMAALSGSAGGKDGQAKAS